VGISAKTLLFETCTAFDLMLLWPYLTGLAPEFITAKGVGTPPLRKEIFFLLSFDPD
jgi:hypothetical protein